jgi:MSHA biogenesis protein MshN
MSIVNQVLNELEKRGADTSIGGATIRPVAPRRKSYLMRYVIVAVLALVLLVVGKWYLERQKDPAPERSIDMAAPISGAALAVPVIAVSDAVSAPVEAVSLLSESGVQSTSRTFDSLRGKPLLEVKSEEEPVVVPEVKNTVRPKSVRTTQQVAEETDSPTPESLEQLKKTSPQQRAENEFLKANRAVQEGRTNDALAGYESALLADPTYKAARRAWAGLLVSLKRNNDAEPVLQRGLKRDIHDTGFAMLLARLQVERGDVPLALETLQKTLPYAGEQADYQSFVAALQQRQGRHDEAVAHYQIALKLVPNNGLWLMGIGISLQALQRKEEARDAYQRALASNSLSAQLQAYVKQKLNEL